MATDKVQTKSGTWVAVIPSFVPGLLRLTWSEQEEPDDTAAWRVGDGSQTGGVTLTAAEALELGGQLLRAGGQAFEREAAALAGGAAEHGKTVQAADDEAAERGAF